MRLRKTSLVIGQVAVATVAASVAFLLYAGITTHRASTNAEALCERVHVGQDYRSAHATLLGGHGDFFLSSTNHDWLGVGFQGAFVERWFCNASFKNGKVSKVWTRDLD